MRRWGHRVSAASFGASLVLVTVGLPTTPADAEEPPICAGQTPTIAGTTGNDHLVGTVGRDVIVGWAGDDTIEGLGGDDLICGNVGDDTVAAGGGDDRAWGGWGADELSGDNGEDRVVGGQGDDFIDGGAGGLQDERLDGGAGDDTIETGPDGGEVSMGTGRDTVTGGDGTDVVSADLRDDLGDFVSVGAGNDLVLVGDGDDAVYLGGGIDRLSGGGGDDRIAGGAGPDDLLVTPGEGSWLQGGRGIDRISLAYVDSGITLDLAAQTLTRPVNAAVAGFEEVSGPIDRINAIYGSDAAETIRGGFGSGRDRIVARGGDDWVITDFAEDRILAGPGDDHVESGAGDDYIDGGAGDDYADGGDGFPDGDICLNVENPYGCTFTGTFTPVSVSWVSSDVGYAVGWTTQCDTARACPALKRSSDGGATWTTLAAPPFEWVDSTRSRFVSGWFFERDGATTGIVNYRGAAYATYDGGSTWQVEDFGSAAAEVFFGTQSVAATSTHVYAVVNCCADEVEATVYRSPIGVRDWQPSMSVPHEGGNPGSIAAGGSTVALSVPDPIDDELFFTTVDNGGTWTEHAEPCAAESEEQSASAISGPGSVYVTCTAIVDNTHRLLRSTDGGVSFEPVTPPNDQQVLGLAARDTTLLAGTIANCAAYVSDDAAQSWQQIELDPEARHAERVQLVGSNTAYMVCAGNDIGDTRLYRSPDNGQTWQRVPVS